MSESRLEIYGGAEGAAPPFHWSAKRAGDLDTWAELPHAASDPADARLWRAVREALLRSGYRRIEVGVRHGLVTLEGCVEDIPARVLAEDCCLRLPEVRDVRNLLRVAPVVS